MTTNLIVTVDTEEEGLWGNGFPAFNNTVRNIEGVPGFQEVCENLGIKPVYLVNTPVLDNPEAVNTLRKINDRGDCEIGTHIHPWNTPPVQPNITSRDSYLCNLSPDTQKEKLEHVTTHIGRLFGAQPTSFRSGRYGADLTTVRLLADLGYKTDSSVCPFTSYAEDGGPNFEDYPWHPYYVGEDFKVPSGRATSILEVPVSFGFNWTDFSSSFALYRFLGHPIAKKARVRGVLDRLGLLQKLKFSPEKHPPKDLITLARKYHKQHNPALVMMFHSSSLTPGGSPYVSNASSVKALLRTIEQVCDFCLNSLAMSSQTLSSFTAEFEHKQKISPT